MITNCNCAERIDCGCTVSFDTYGNNLYSALSVGNLVGSGCTFTQYVIDWYRNGEHAMTSGKGVPGLDAYHPFTGAAAIPVKAGTWVPVLRYVVLDGVKVFATPRNCQKWCSDLQGNLPTITVLPLTCDVVSGSPPGGYTFRMSYTTTQDFSYATRTIRWELPSDGSMGYLALQFTGYIVADRVQVLYNDETTPLADYYVGTELAGNRGDTIPNQIDLQSVKMIANISDRVYQTGDYLTIKVTPSWNSNTQWVLDMKCLNKGVFNCTYFPLTLRDFDFSGLQVTFDSVNCKYLITIPMSPMAAAYYSSVLYAYNSIGQYATGDCSVNQTTGLVTLTMWDKVFCTGEALHTHYDSDVSGPVYYAKVGTTFTFTCTSVNDYNMYKAWYNSNRSNWKFSSYSADPLSINHYKIFQITWKEVHTRCGDVFAYKSLYFHWDSLVTFNDMAMTMTIQLCDIVNQFPRPDPVLKCVNTWGVINSWVTTCQNSRNAADWSGWTMCREGRPVNGVWIYEQTWNDVSKNFYWAFGFPVKSLENFCGLTGWAEFPALSWRYQFQRFNIQVEITNTDDRANNFRISSQLNRETGENTGTFQRIYEIENGIQVYP
jgi:hypothetical protein